MDLVTGSNCRDEEEVWRINSPRERVGVTLNVGRDGVERVPSRFKSDATFAAVSCLYFYEILRTVSRKFKGQ